MKTLVKQVARRFAAVVALMAFGFAGSAAGECRFVAALKEGRQQKIVCYGTSLTVLSSNWVSGLQETLDARWPGLATVVNSGLSGQNSATGLAQVQTKVVAKNPDAVLIEFSMNDAADNLNTGKTAEQALADAESNLKAIIAAILAGNPDCEIILETMNDYVAVPGSKLSNRTGLVNHAAMYRRVAAENGYLLIDHWPKWQEVLAKGEEEYIKLVPDGVHPNAEGSALVTLPNLLRTLGITDKWVEETATMKSVTGAWSGGAAYGADGKAAFSDNTFTPYIASTGNVVTVEFTAQFCAVEDSLADCTGAQAAVRLGPGGSFQVWAKTGNRDEGTGNRERGMGNGWVDVEAAGVTPESGAEYTLRFIFDYSANTYSVNVKCGDEWLPLNATPNSSTPNSSTPNSSTPNSSFPLAAAAISSIRFAGDTLFTSMFGDCMKKFKGFIMIFR